RHHGRLRHQHRPRRPGRPHRPERKGQRHPRGADGRARLSRPSRCRTRRRPDGRRLSSSPGPERDAAASRPLHPPPRLADLARAACLAPPPLTRHRLRDARRVTSAGMPVSSLYVHVPFCPSVCPYCDFHKMLRHEGLAARYVARLAQELAALAEEHGGPLETLYLGGGTPSHLRDDELERVFAALAGFGGPARLETTLEADPLTFDAERLTRFASLGVTRLSIGLQSTQDHVLAFLGRLHDGAQGLAAVEAALSSG